MSRIILQSGKGGVGKTTVSAATGLAASRRGYRTLVLSFDLAHSLSDSFDCQRALFDNNKGLPVTIAERLDIQEIDIQEEMGRHWGEVYKYFALLFSNAGVSDVMAEEMAILPGMEDLVTLLYINEYVNEGKYDVIVVDCPPTGESIRFFSMTTTLEWYMSKRFNIERKLLRLARPLTKLIDRGSFPEDSYFDALEKLYQQVKGVERILTDPAVTTVRLVTNAERMVVKETQRAYMYFNLYNINTDMIVVNRLLPGDQEFFKNWAQVQAKYVEEIESYFHPIPVARLPFLEHEVLGMDRLAEIEKLLFGDSDPVEVRAQGRQFSFEKKDAGYVLRLHMPFVEKKDIDLTKHESDLIVRVGSFKRYVPLPRAVAGLNPVGAEYKEQELRVTFQ